jgi:hypothetical protein
MKDPPSFSIYRQQQDQQPFAAGSRRSAAVFSFRNLILPSSQLSLHPILSITITVLIGNPFSNITTQPVLCFSIAI